MSYTSMIRRDWKWILSLGILTAAWNYNPEKWWLAPMGFLSFLLGWSVMWYLMHRKRKQ